MNAKTAIGAALLAGGATLLFFGNREYHSFASDVAQVFTGSPTNRAMWMIVGGVACAVCGAFLAFAGRKG